MRYYTDASGPTDYPRVILILWSAVFILLIPSCFILVHSRALPKRYKETQQWTGNVVDNTNDTRREELLESSLKANATEPQVTPRKVHVHLNRRNMTIRRRLRRNREKEVFLKKSDLQILRSSDLQKNKRRLTNLIKHTNTRMAKKNAARQSLERTNVTDIVGRKFTRLQNEDNSTRNSSIQHTAAVAPLNTSFQISSNDSSNHASNNKSRQQSVDCQPTGDIYITDVNEKVPSYACKLGNNTFFLSSMRFSHDRRYSLNVSVDDDTLRKLVNDSLSFTENVPLVIEIVLVLKSNSENYEIRQRAEL